MMMVGNIAEGHFRDISIHVPLYVGYPIPR